MERTYLQWNIVNWVTVVLMATVGMAAVGMGTAFFKARSGGGMSDDVGDAE